MPSSEYTGALDSIRSRMLSSEQPDFDKWRRPFDQLLLSFPPGRDPKNTTAETRAKLCVWSLLRLAEQNELYDPLKQLARQQELVIMKEVNHLMQPGTPFHQRIVEIKADLLLGLDSEIKKRYNSGAKCRRQAKAAERAAHAAMSGGAHHTQPPALPGEDEDAEGETDDEWLAAQSHGHNTFHALGKSLVALSLRQQVHYGQTHAGGHARRAF